MEDYPRQTGWWLNYVLVYQNVSETFLRKHINYDAFDWGNVSSWQKLSIGFVKEFEKNIAWDRLSDNPKLAEDIVLEFYSKLNIDSIINRHDYYPELSSEFIKRLKKLRVFS